MHGRLKHLGQTPLERRWRRRDRETPLPLSPDPLLDTYAIFLLFFSFFVRVSRLSNPTLLLGGDGDREMLVRLDLESERFLTLLLAHDSLEVVLLLGEK